MMPLEGKLEIARACELAPVSRAGFYREYVAHAPREAETAVRDAIQRIVIEGREQGQRMGWRPVQAALERLGWVVNHKRVQRIMREDNLLSLRKRRFVLTTDSSHPYGVYANLAEGLTLTRLNQLWVADITYIRLREEFVYLAVILDAFSRKALGWDLEDTLEARLALRALERALAARAVAPGIMHHSDQGVQYASKDYVDKLLGHGFLISMSRKASPWENARAESFMKTLKTEEVYLREYRDQEEARQSITHFLEEVYNRKRLHSSLGYLAPEEFELRSGGAGPTPAQGGVGL
jgi:putative transposase